MPSRLVPPLASPRAWVGSGCVSCPFGVLGYSYVLTHPTNRSYPALTDPTRRSPIPPTTHPSHPPPTHPSHYPPIHPFSLRRLPPPLSIPASNPIPFSTPSTTTTTPSRPTLLHLNPSYPALPDPIPRPHSTPPPYRHPLPTGLCHEFDT